jgi:hypothetical protein
MRQEWLKPRCKSRRTLISGAVLVSTVLLPGANTAFAALISDGSFIQGFYNNGTQPTYTAFTTFGPNIYNYTNGIQSQASFSLSGPGPGVLANAYPSYVNASAAVSPTTSLAVTVSDPDTASGGFASGTAEIWDTLQLGNLPTGAVSLIGTLNFTITSSVQSTGALFGAQAAYGFALYNVGTYIPNSTGGDCAMQACGGLDYAVGNGGALTGSGIVENGVVPTSTTYSIPITLAEAEAAAGHGGLAYIAELAGYVPAQGPYGGNGTLTLDPTVTLTNLYPGVTVSSASGVDYAPVPLPAAAWLLLSGLGGIGFIARRRKAI